jgi:hypothetical protein
MAKPLTSLPPSSSVAKLLEPGIGAAATRPMAVPHAGMPAGPPAGAPAPSRSDAAPDADETDFTPATGEQPDIKREFTLTRSTDDTLSELLALYQRTTGCRLHTSHLMRALLKALRQAMPEVEREARVLGPLRRPSNASGREAERDEFESRLGASLLAGLRAGRHSGEDR